MILKALAITASHPLGFSNHFWDRLKAWNKNMVAQFTPSWVSCLDESMSTWMNKYTCPGWIFMPMKPWPFGNEYHTVCCSLSGILWQLELVEGKDAPLTIILKFNNQEKNSWIVASSVGVHLWKGQCCGPGHWILHLEGNCSIKKVWSLCFHFDKKVEVLA